MNQKDEVISELEIELLLEAIQMVSGYDFREYSKFSLARVVKRDLAILGLTHISELIPVILHDKACLETLTQNLSVNVTVFFRNPEILRHLIDNVFSALQSFPFIKIWHAGCSVGKEAYSLPILFHEQGLPGRCLIYATDFNHKVLSTAKNGVYSREEVEALNEKYKAGGRKHHISGYFHSQYNITFAHHNLEADGVFAEVQLIFCTNVLIYFIKDLKFRVITLFHVSLYPSRYLLLGPTDILNTGSPKFGFTEIGLNSHLYKKTPTLNSFTPIK